MSLQDNLDLATQVAMSVRKAIPRSANSAESGSPTLASGDAVNTASWRKLNKMRSDVGRVMPDNPSDWLDSLQKLKTACTKKGMGNCGEVAAVACLSLKEAGAFPVEYVQIEDGVTGNAVVPHVVAVIGRQAVNGPAAWPADLSPIGLPDTWHADAVICDPWARIAYPAKDYDEFWDGLRGHSTSPATLTCRLIHQL